MALQAVQNWHMAQMAQERARVAARIAYGTNASSPQTVSARRANPLYHSNPLPDNSSGSKNRPFFASKDESGRASADQLVAMAQGKAHFGHEGMPDHVAMRGGVLRNYKYARMILNRLGQDSENINLASQGLPPAAPLGPGLELTDIDSRNMELDAALAYISDSVDSDAISSLTINELKNVPRLMMYLAPSFDDGRITDLKDAINNILTVIDTTYPATSNSDKARNAERISKFLQTVSNFLTEFSKYVEFSLEDKQTAALQLGKQIFKLSIKSKAASKESPSEQGLRDLANRGRTTLDKALTKEQLKSYLGADASKSNDKSVLAAYLTYKLATNDSAKAVAKKYIDDYEKKQARAPAAEPTRAVRRQRVEQEEEEEEEAEE